MGQEAIRKNQVFLTNSQAVPLEELDREGAKNVKVRNLIDDRHGSDRFALRLYTVPRGGHTPLDRHAYEHQVYILSGQGLIRQEEDDRPFMRTVRPGDAIFVPSNAVHQFSNVNEEPLVFLCVKGNPMLYSSGAQAGASSGESTDKNCC